MQTFTNNMILAVITQILGRLQLRSLDFDRPRSRVYKQRGVGEEFRIHSNVRRVPPPLGQRNAQWSSISTCVVPVVHPGQKSRRPTPFGRVCLGKYCVSNRDERLARLSRGWRRSACVRGVGHTGTTSEEGGRAARQSSHRRTHRVFVWLQPKECSYPRRTVSSSTTTSSRVSTIMPPHCEQG